MAKRDKNTKEIPLKYTNKPLAMGQIMKEFNHSNKNPFKNEKHHPHRCKYLQQNYSVFSDLHLKFLMFELALLNISI